MPIMIKKISLLEFSNPRRESSIVKNIWLLSKKKLFYFFSFLIWFIFAYNQVKMVKFFHFYQRSQFLLIEKCIQKNLSGNIIKNFNPKNYTRNYSSFILSTTFHGNNWISESKLSNFSPRIFVQWLDIFAWQSFI